MQPSGTVTLVFTDIDGSTRLLEELGQERYRQALAEHRERIRNAFATGYEVDYEGDSFFYAFASASAAVAAVREALSALAEGPIKVRVGIHTGEPGLDPPKYVGMDVHRAARIMSCAHGGQALLSQSTRELLADDDGLRDLGEHRLKDLSAPLRLYQLGDGDFPPLRSLHRTNLPVPATSFLGRERELAEVAAHLDRDDVRLLTLSGPGGTGKTRLALRAAADAVERFTDGVYWVPLAALRDPALVLSAVAQALELREQPGRELAEILRERLLAKRILLLLDNFEQLLPEAAASVALLRDVPGPLLVVTSRERLELAGEHVYVVPSLVDADAEALFTARAKQLDPSFVPTPAVATLCGRLDNLPLAIELAAARTTLFSAEQLLDRLGRRLDLLKGSRDADPRQQTLRAAIDWSYQLLDAEEQRVYRALSVFAGGSGLEAAEHICDAEPETLQSLLDKSLLRRRDAELGPRYWMLESLREYAAERLVEAGETDELAGRHARWYTELAERADREQRSLLLDAWLVRLALEEHNLRAAIAWAMQRNDGSELARLAASLGLTWVWRGELAEVRGWLDGAAERVEPREVSLRARTLMVAGFVRAMQGDHAAAQSVLEEALATCRSVGDVEGVGFCLNSLGIAASSRGDAGEARALWEECRQLAEAHGLEDRLAIAALNLSGLALEERRTDEARALAERAARTFADAHSPLWCNTLLVLANVARLEMRQGEAERLLRQCLAACLQRSGRSVGGAALMGMAPVLAARGDGRGAALTLGAAEGVLEAVGLSSQMTEELERARADVSQRLSRAELQELVAEGRALSFEEAAHRVLQADTLSPLPAP